MTHRQRCLALVSMGLALALGLGATVGWSGSPVVGSLVGSVNATVDGQAALANATLFSGDRLEVREGAAIVALGKGSRLVFGQETTASLHRASRGITVDLARGQVALVQAQESMPFTVKIGEVSVTAAEGFRTLGEVALLNGEITVAAKSGRLNVADGASVTEVNPGEKINIPPPKPQRSQRGSATAGTVMSSRKKRIIIATLVAAGATGGVVAAIMAQEDKQVSPSAP